MKTTLATAELLEPGKHAIIEPDGCLLRIAKIERDAAYTTVYFHRDGMIPVKPLRVPNGRILVISA